MCMWWQEIGTENFATKWGLLLEIKATVNFISSTIAMMFGPNNMTNVDHQGNAAAAIVATLVIGCGVGSEISKVLFKALRIVKWKAKTMFDQLN